MSWPITTSEFHPWVPTRVAKSPNTSSPQRQYESAITPDIAHHQFALPAALAAIVDDATNTIVRFDSAFGEQLAPFNAILMRSESVASSEIEKLSASAENIAREELNPVLGLHDEHAQLIVANTRAMKAATDLADNIHEDAILAMHETLLAESQPNHAGRWRQQQVWIGGNGFSPFNARYVPPHHSRVPHAIHDLVSFIHREDIPALVQAALAHAQFETIHPFTDGNGRTGRALIHSILRNKGTVQNITVPVSSGLLNNVNRYYDALNSYREGDAEAIVYHLAEASFHAVDNGWRLVIALRTIRQDWDVASLAGKSVRLPQIADLFLRQPVLNAATIATELGIDTKNIQRVLNPLITAGLIEELTDQKRNRLWRAPEVLEALDNFAYRAGRRTRVTE